MYFNQTKMSFGLSNVEEDYDLEEPQQQPIADQRRRPAQRRPRDEEEEKEYPRNARQRPAEEDSEPEEPQQQFHSRSSLLNQQEESGDPLAAMGERKKQWKSYIPNMFDPLMLDQMEKEYIPDPEWCFLEWYSESSLREEEQAPIRMLIRLIKENWEKMSMPALMLEAQKYYNEKIRCKYEELKDKPWSMRKIYEYFTMTNPDITIMMEEQMRTLWHAAYITSRHELFEFDEYFINNERRVDYRINKEALMKYKHCTLRIDQLQDKLSSSRSRNQA